MVPPVCAEDRSIDRAQQGVRSLRAMIHVSQTVTVNEGAEPKLEVPQIWHGLVMKAEDPTRFVRSITACRILERFDDGLVREVTLRGQPVRERIVYRKPECVTFVRLNGSELGM